MEISHLLRSSNMGQKKNVRIRLLAAVHVLVLLLLVATSELSLLTRNIIFACLFLTNVIVLPLVSVVDLYMIPNIYFMGRPIAATVFLGCIMLSWMLVIVPAGWLIRELPWATIVIWNSDNSIATGKNSILLLKDKIVISVDGISCFTALLKAAPDVTIGDVSHFFSRRSGASVGQDIKVKSAIVLGRYRLMYYCEN